MGRAQGSEGGSADELVWCFQSRQFSTRVADCVGFHFTLDLGVVVCGGEGGPFSVVLLSAQITSQDLRGWV